MARPLAERLVWLATGAGRVARATGVGRASERVAPVAGRDADDAGVGAGWVGAGAGAAAGATDLGGALMADGA